MLAISGPFPLTSDQPPVALLDPAVLASFTSAARRSAAAGDAAEVSTARGASRLSAVPAGSETQNPWALDPARDPYALIGPRPSFEANVLDAERDFDAKLARIELARSQAEMRRGSDPADAAEKARAAAGAGAGAQGADHAAPQAQAASDGIQMHQAAAQGGVADGPVPQPAAADQAGSQAA